MTPARKRKIVVFILLGCMMLSSSLSRINSAHVNSDDVSAIILVTDSFGWNYFDAVSCFEEIGVDVTTISFTLDHEVFSCVNRETRSITSDYTISEVNRSFIQGFDILYVPSGGHWSRLSDSQTVTGLIEEAYLDGLVIGTACIGQMVVASANGIVNNSKIAFFSLAYDDMRNEGAEPINHPIVSDNNIVTCASGGGPPDGYKDVPMREVCMALVREALDLSPVSDVMVEPGTGTVNTTFSISFNAENDIQLKNYTSDISEVTLWIRDLNDQTNTNDVDLQEADGVHQGTVDGLACGNYTVEIQVADNLLGVQVLHNLKNFEVTEHLEPDTGSIKTNAVSLYLKIGVSLTILVAIILLFRKRI